MPSVDWKHFKAPTKFLSFLECCEKHFLKQHVTESTRPNSNSLLDIVLSTMVTDVSNVLVEECFGSSDHSIITFLLNSPNLANRDHYYTTKRNYNKANWNRLCTLLSQADWDSVFRNKTDIDNVWLNFKKHIALTESIPMRKKNHGELKVIQEYVLLWGRLADVIKSINWRRMKSLYYDTCKLKYAYSSLFKSRRRSLRSTLWNLCARTQTDFGPMSIVSLETKTKTALKA